MYEIWGYFNFSKIDYLWGACMVIDTTKNIGKVVSSDFVNTPAPLNDVSDVDITKLQYSSPIIEKMKQDCVYDGLCFLVKSLKFADKSDQFIIQMIKTRYKTYCGSLTPITLKKWLSVYVELREAYYSGRDIALGELVCLGMERARKSVNSERPDDFIVKLMDRIDDGTLHYKNKQEAIDKEAEVSKLSVQTAATLSKMFVESERFGGLENVKVTDDPIDDDTYTTREDDVNE